jgi:hypothetical protein
MPVPLGNQTLPSTLPLKLAPGLFIATAMFISLPADGLVGVMMTPLIEALAIVLPVSSTNTKKMIPKTVLSCDQMLKLNIIITLSYLLFHMTLFP